MLPLHSAVSRKRLRGKTPPPQPFPASSFSPAALPLSPAVARTRLCAKTPPPKPRQAVVVGCQPAGTENSAKRQVYLVTLPHPRRSVSSSGRQLVAPGSLSKTDVLNKFLDACAAPMYADGRMLSNPQPVPIKLAGLWRELHQEDLEGQAYPHDHVPVLAERQFRFNPVKKALLERHGLASHWSCSHDGCWSAIRYLVYESPDKSAEALDNDPVLFAAAGSHPSLEECCHEPLTAAALRSRRLRADHAAAGKGSASARVTELDIFPLVVQNGFGQQKGDDDQEAALRLISFVKTSCSIPIQNFVFKHRHRIPSLIEDIWAWERVEEEVAARRRSAVEDLRAAAAKQCVCNGEWLKLVMQSFIMNQINIAELCHDVYQSLAQGRGPTVPVVVLAGAMGGEGKSVFFKALREVYGKHRVFPAPVAGNFPLIGIPGKKIAFLDDWRFNAAVLPYSLQCLWYDGSAVPVARPQNVPGAAGHLIYEGTAPIFATTKLQDLELLSEKAAPNPETGMPMDGDASMLLRRLKVYSFRHRAPKPQQSVPYCPTCFAKLVLAQGTPQQ